MKTKIIFLPIAILISVLASGDNRYVAASNEQKRVRFQITTVSENAANAARKILAQTTIEGLPGTDFNINLQTENYRMQTRFLSDLAADDKIKLRAGLNTRRFYGYSPANLPLYEEDAQNRTLQIGFGETVVLLPFGENGGAAETLKIEITPALLSVSETNESSRQLKINFDKQIPSGEIFIEASKTPHRFAVEAVLTADGQTIARGVCAECLLEEAKEIVLQPVAGSGFGNRSFAANLTIDKYTRNRPADLVGINFDFYRAGNESDGQTRTIISGGAGVGTLGGELTYPLKDKNLPGDVNYELKFKIRLADGERAD